ncbi:UNVERIFIED_CONTAM: hypothetical protein GTU68_048862 [Idotea baltica]|nr:hypothetical protein [Idotea baltica]
MQRRCLFHAFQIGFRSRVLAEFFLKIITSFFSKAMASVSPLSLICMFILSLH